MPAFEKLVQFVTEKMAWIAMLAVVTCVAVVMTDIFMYNVLQSQIPGTHELVELIASVVMSTSIAYVTFVRGHVSVGIMVDRLRPRTQAFFDLINSIISFIFTAWLSVGVFAMAMRNLRFGWVTGVLQIPRAPFMFLIGVTLVMTCLVLFMYMIKALIVLKEGDGHGA